jgi:peptidoglycan/xylan/chitin deacetylase (PgdA/CDA1 family)
MPLKRNLKLASYRVAKAIGLFRLARMFTARSVRILAYHGFSQTDEHLFRPKLFMTASTFERRMGLIAANGYHVADLDEAVRRLSTGRVQPDTVVITIDDGFARTLTAAAPTLRRYGYPATVYLTTHHMQSQLPVFDVLVGYLCWKARRGRYALSWPEGASPLQLDLSDDATRDQAYGSLLDLGEALADDVSRLALAEGLARALSLPVGVLSASQAFRLMSADEAAQLGGYGIEIGLHTHRHRFPPGDSETCTRELADNASALSAMGLPFSRHFCYPSGVLGPGQMEVLQATGALSATTCEPGLAQSSHHAMRLPRTLDGEDLTDIEFEAELSGFGSLFRRAFDWWAKGAKSP